MEPPDSSEVALLRARVAALEAERDELLYATSHDLAAPLRTLTGFLGLLSRRAGSKLDDRERELLAYVEDGATHLKALVDGVLRVSRVGTHELAPAAVDVVELVRTARERAGAALLQAGAHVEAQAAGAHLHGDPELLARALAALLENAAQAGARGITVAALEHPEGTALVVADDGPGLPADQHAKALALLGRLQGWAERPGAGAGLTVARRVAERHGGTLTLGQSPAGGLQATVLIPRPSKGTP